MSRIGPPAPLPVAFAPRLSIDQLLWVANTRHGPGGHWYARVAEDRGDHDHLHDAADAAEYLARHHVPIPVDPPSPRHLARLVAIREMVRGLLEPDRPPWTPEALAILNRSCFTIEAGVDAVAVHAAGDGWDGLIDDLMLPLLQLVQLRHGLRICGNPYCRLVFLDLSKAGSRRWCDSGGCGNRARVGRYRRSRAAGALDRR